MLFPIPHRGVSLIIVIFLVWLMVDAPYSYAQAQRIADIVFTEAEALRMQGTAQSYRQAIVKYQEAANLYHTEGKKEREAESLVSAGFLYGNLGESQNALVHMQRVLPLVRAVGNRRDEAATLTNIGAVHSALGEQQKALAYFQQALPLSRAVGDRSVEAKILNNIGVLYGDLGEQQKALAYHQQALPLRQGAADRGGEATTLLNIGVVYNSLGEKKKALAYIEPTLPLFRALGDRDGEATTLNNMGDIYTELGEHQQGLTYMQQALSLLRALGNRRGEAKTLSNIGVLYGELGEPQKALAYFLQALPLLRGMEDRRGEATTLTNIGIMYNLLGEQRNALAYLQQALVGFRATGNQSGEATVLGSLSSVWNKVQDVSGRIAFLKLAINLHQQLRSTNRALDTEAQRAFYRINEKTYAVLTDLLLRQGRLAEALEALHLGRDQGFFDQGFQRGIQTVPSVKTMMLTLRESHFAKALETAVNLKSRGQQLPQLVAELNVAPSAENRLTTTPDLTEMQQTLRLLQQRTGTKVAAIYALMSPAECRTLLVTADSIITASAKIKQVDLNQLVQVLLQRLQSNKTEPKGPSKELYEVFFKPIEAEVRNSGATLLLWSLDQNLRGLPMAALWDGQQYLAERYQNAVFTRPTSERMLRNGSRPWSGLGFGTAKEYPPFEPLEGAAAELHGIFGESGKKGILPGSVWEDEVFTKQSFLAALKQGKPLVHIASHFNFKPGDDERSYLLLGDGSRLTLAEMKQQAELFKGVELLTLSACQTADVKADGKFNREIDSFAEVAQRLGAGAVLASLWPADDGSTPELMQEFYRIREAGKGMTKAQALQQAQLKMIKEGRYAHPYYWAPFILIGNWK